MGSWGWDGMPRGKAVAHPLPGGPLHLEIIEIAELGAQTVSVQGKQDRPPENLWAQSRGDLGQEVALLWV